MRSQEDSSSEGLLVTSTTSPRDGSLDAELANALKDALDGDVRFDEYTRAIFSTDASMYSITPVGVTFPKHADDVAAALELANQFGVPVIPRGAGTSHCGQTVGAAIVLDLSRHMHGIDDIDPEARVATVQPGVVQDHLGLATAPHGLWFAPDTSTANRATIGGMIGNNSSGSRSARYGMTIDHVQSVDVILSDGSRTTLDAADEVVVAARARSETLAGRIWRDVPKLIREHDTLIQNRLPGYWRQSGGYRLERVLKDDRVDLAKLMVGSEGTLGVVVGARVSLETRPSATVTGIGHFRTIEAAIEAAADAIDCQADGIELVDDFILRLARSSPMHQHLTDILHGEPGALLFVEFYGSSRVEASHRLQHLEGRWKRHSHGYAVVRAIEDTQQAQVRALRRAGLGLLMASSTGRERSLAFVEDTAVPPEHLAEYTRRFAAILESEGLRAGFYGHASAGCLHVRPFMDLTRPGEPEKLEAVATAVKDLVIEFNGANSSEHGDGLVRSPFNRELFGDELYEVMRTAKRHFDPQNLLNPGKKVDAEPMTNHLREPQLPEPGAVQTFLSFDREGGLFNAANSCMRIGACRKGATSGGAMCPSYMATRDEEHSTRGRANALVHALTSPHPQQELGSDRLHEVLDLCLECKACKSECPLSVDMAKMKSEALAQRYARTGTPIRAWAFRHVRLLNRLGSAVAPLSNLAGRNVVIRTLMEWTLGIDRRRPLPKFHRETLTKWFRRRRSRPDPPVRGDLVFLADCFTTFTEPAIGKAAIEVLEKAGWRVRVEGDVCCGRSMLSKGLLSNAREAAKSLMSRLLPYVQQGVPIVGCEPSCMLTLRDEYFDLCPDAEKVRALADNSHLFEEILLTALDDKSLTISSARPHQVLFHGHCHQKAGPGTAATVQVLDALPDVDVIELDAGCCGMAGSFGFESEHYDLSMAIGGQRLFPAVNNEEATTLVVANGVSCRQQISHGTGRTAQHPAEFVRERIN